MQKNSLIEVITPQFWPHHGPSAIYFEALVHGLRHRKQRLRVFCSGKEHSVASDNADGLEVIRFGYCVDQGTPRWLRLKRLVLFHAGAFWEVILKRNKTFVWIIDGPLYWNLGSILAALLTGVDFVYLVHDLYPDVLVTSGLLRARFFVDCFSRMETYPMRKAKATLVLTKGMAQVLKERLGKQSGRVSVLRFPVSPLFSKYRIRHGRQDFPCPPVLLYAGSLGIAHHIAPFLSWAERAKQSGDKIIFRLVTSSQRKLALKTGTIDCQEAVPWEDLPELYGGCSAGYVGLPVGWGDSSMPSKVFSVLASGRPIVAVADERSELCRLIRDEEIGLVLTPAMAETLVGYHAVLSFLQSPEQLSESARKAVIFVRKWHSPGEVAKELLGAILRREAL